MHLFGEFWGAYAICYAIGYMLWVRPRVQDKPYAFKANLAFYVSLVLLSTLKFLVALS